MVSEDSRGFSPLVRSAEFYRARSVSFGGGMMPPLLGPFLLIVCTWDIVTAGPTPNGTGDFPLVVQDTQSFQHIARFCNGLEQPGWRPGNNPHTSVFSCPG